MKNLILILGFIFSSSQLFALNDWNIIPLPTSENLNEIQFVNDSVGFIAGENGVLLKTIDKGQNWSIIQTPDTFDILSLAFISETAGGILMKNSFNQPQFFVTYNNGITWQAKPHTLNGLCFANVLFAVEDKIIIGGNGCFYGDGISVFQNDTIVTDTIVTDTMLNIFGTIVQFDFVDDQIGFASSNYNAIYKTVDGGFTWQIIDLPDSIVRVYDIAFYDEMNGYLVGIDTFDGSWPKVVFKTEDGGQTWEDDLGALFVTPKFTDVSYVAPDSVIVLGHYEGIFNDNGTAWFNFYGQSVTGFTEWWATDTNTFKVKKNDLFVQKECIYIIGDEGFLSTYGLAIDSTADSTHTGVNTLEEIDSHLYPNPSTNYITMHLQNMESGNYSFQIFDLLGKNLYSEKEFVNKEFYKKIDVENFENGVYFFKLSKGENVLCKSFQIAK